MAVTADIVRAWRSPRRVMGTHVARGVREDLALVYLILGCFLMFLAQSPRLWRDAILDPEIPFDVRLGAALLGWIFLAPIAFYVMAAMSRVFARILGGRGSWYSARLALFWAVLASAPLWLINGLIAGFVGPGLVMVLSGGVALAIFFMVWIASLYEVETKGEST